MGGCTVGRTDVFPSSRYRSVAHCCILLDSASTVLLLLLPLLRCCCCSYVTVIPRGIASHHVTVTGTDKVTACSYRYREAPGCSDLSLHLPVQAADSWSHSVYFARRRTGDRGGLCARRLQQLLHRLTHTHNPSIASLLFTLLLLPIPLLLTGPINVTDSDVIS